MKDSAADTASGRPIPVADLHAQRRRLGDGIENALRRVLEHGRFLAGPEIEKLESQLAVRAGAGRAIACASGTDALVMALLALDVRPGDAVLVPGYTFVATAEAVALIGAAPVFLDVRADDFNMDPAAIAVGAAAAKDAGLRPVGVVAVDLFGHLADYAAIEPAAEEHGLWLVSDAAQSYGASRDGRKAGSIGAIATTSFYPSKPLGCYGDGGAVMTGDGALAEAMLEVRDHGRSAATGEHARVGLTGRIDTFQAAVLLEKLAVFDEEIEMRGRVAERYREMIERDVGDAVAPAVHRGAVPVWAQYTVRLPRGRRDAVQRRMAQAGVSTAVHYRTPLHRQPAYSGYPVAGGSLPVAEALSETVLSLPMHAYLPEGDQERVIAALAEAMAEEVQP